MRPRIVTLFASALLVPALPSQAQPSPASAQPQVVQHQPTEPAEPVIVKNRVRHGLYLRMYTNTGYLVIAGDGPNGHASIAGLGSGALVALGGTVTRGVILAGTIQAANTPATFNGGPFGGATVTRGDRTTNASAKVDATVSQVGALIDYYPHPALGWHLGLAASWCVLSLVNRADESMYYGSAFGGTLFGGYDWSIGGDWSMGLALFGSGSTTASMRESEHKQDTGYRLRSLSAGIAGSLLYF